MVALSGGVSIELDARNDEGRRVDASNVATAVDAVVASPAVSMGRYAVAADAVRLGTDTVALRRGGVVSRADFSAPVTPVHHGTLLWELLQGARPDHLFRRVDGFERAVAAAQACDHDWRPDVDRIRVRPVRWRGVEATLIGL